jgi:hypothetical protein
VKDTENMAEQRTADVRTVDWSLRQKEMRGIVLDAIHSLRSSARVTSFLDFDRLSLVKLVPQPVNESKRI